MDIFWFTVNVVIAWFLFAAATEKIRSENKAAWILILTGSAWNAAAAASMVL
jgi:hypothetical protein